MSKRGRPRKYSESWIRQVGNIFNEVGTERGLRNKIQMVHAIGVLEKRGRDVDNLTFLIDQANIAHPFKQSILTELGKFEDDDELLRVATDLCNYAKTHKATVHEWAEIVRRIRLGKV